MTRPAPIRSIQKKILISVLAFTLALCFCVAFFSYLFSFNLVRRRVSESFSLTLDYICSNMDAKLSKVYGLADYIFINNSVKKFVESNHLLPTSKDYKHEAEDAIKQYTISQFYQDVNRITIVDREGNKLQHLISYVDFTEDGLSGSYDEWKLKAGNANGKCVWIGMISRNLNPTCEDSPIVNEAILLRSIKNSNYSKDIGFFYIALNSRFFLNQTQDYQKNYPDYSENCKLFILDNNKNILNPDENFFSNEDFENILASSESYTNDGYLLKSKKTVFFVKEFGNGWKLVGTIPNSLFTASNTYLFFMSLVAFFLSIITCGFLWYYVSKIIFKPIHSIAVTVKSIENGNPNQRINVSSHDEIGELGKNINNMLERLDSLNRENLKKELKMRDTIHYARLLQTNPHFIYNALSSIRWLAVMTHSSSIKEAIDSLWVIVKYNMNRDNTYYTRVKDEIEIVKRYISLQKLSYANKFEVTWDVSNDSLECKCIKFFLQPLVENSIIHGAFPKKQECSIFISIYKENNKLVFNIYDNGVGINDKELIELKNLSSKKIRNSHVGFANILERLRYAYNNDFWFDISSEVGHFTNVMIKIPINYKLRIPLSEDLNDTNNDS